MPLRALHQTRDPYCPECGALLAKPKRHRRWHKQQAKRQSAVKQPKT